MWRHMNNTRELGSPVRARRAPDDSFASLGVQAEAQVRNAALAHRAGCAQLVRSSIIVLGEAVSDAIAQIEYFGAYPARLALAQDLALGSDAFRDYRERVASLTSQLEKTFDADADVIMARLMIRATSHDAYTVASNVLACAWAQLHPRGHCAELLSLDPLPDAHVDMVLVVLTTIEVAPEARAAAADAFAAHLARCAATTTLDVRPIDDTLAFILDHDFHDSRDQHETQPHLLHLTRRVKALLASMAITDRAYASAFFRRGLTLRVCRMMFRVVRTCTRTPITQSDTLLTVLLDAECESNKHESQSDFIAYGFDQPDPESEHNRRSRTDLHGCTLFFASFLAPTQRDHGRSHAVECDDEMRTHCRDVLLRGARRTGQSEWRRIFDADFIHLTLWVASSIERYDKDAAARVHSDYEPLDSSRARRLYPHLVTSDTGVDWYATMDDLRSGEVIDWVTCVASLRISDPQKSPLESVYLGADYAPPGFFDAPSKKYAVEAFYEFFLRGRVVGDTGRPSVLCELWGGIAAGHWFVYGHMLVPYLRNALATCLTGKASPHDASYVAATWFTGRINGLSFSADIRDGIANDDAAEIKGTADLTERFTARACVMQLVTGSDALQARLIAIHMNLPAERRALVQRLVAPQMREAYAQFKSDHYSPEGHFGGTRLMLIRPEPRSIELLQYASADDILFHEHLSRVTSWISEALDQRVRVLHRAVDGDGPDTVPPALRNGPSAPHAHASALFAPSEGDVLMVELMESDI